MADRLIDVYWVAYGWEHLSRETVRRRFSNAPRTDDFGEWRDWLADLDPTEQADLQDLAHAQWVTHGSEQLSLETVRRHFPGAPRTDAVPEWQNWLAQLNQAEEGDLLHLTDVTMAVADDSGTVVFESAEVSAC